METSTFKVNIREDRVLILTGGCATCSPSLCNMHNYIAKEARNFIHVVIDVMYADCDGTAI